MHRGPSIYYARIGIRFEEVRRTFPEPIVLAHLQITLEHLTEVDSTNDEARRLAERGEPEGTAVWADVQTRGRGRYGREWVSAGGANLLMSVILRPRLPPERLGLITMAGAVAVADAIETVTDISPEIKWPNDVQIRGRKVSGMLLESAPDTGPSAGSRYVILGIGVNVNQRTFPPHLHDTATSLLLETGGPVSRVDFLETLAGRLVHHYGWLERDDGASVHASFVQRLTGLGETVKLCFPESGSSVEGRLAGVAADGGLELALPDGDRRVFYAGEVSSKSAG